MFFSFVCSMCHKLPTRKHQHSKCLPVALVPARTTSHSVDSESVWSRYWSQLVLLWLVGYFGFWHVMFWHFWLLLLFFELQYCTTATGILVLVQY
jgi:hypothetical protein